MYFYGLNDGNQGKSAMFGGYEQTLAEMKDKKGMEGIRKEQQKARRNRRKDKK